MWTAASSYSVRLILNSALWLTAAGIMVRGCGAVREMVFAATFGVSRETDLFLLAVTYAMFLPSVLSSALGTALVAQFAKLRSGAGLPGIGELRPLAHGVCLSALAAALATYVFAPVLLRALFGLHGADLEKAVTYSRILAPLGLTMVLSASMDALLNSAKQFFVPGVTSSATPLMMIAAIVFLGYSWGVEAAAWGMIAGGLLEVWVLVATIRRQRRALFASNSAEAGDSQIFWRGVSFLALSSAIAALSPLVDQVFLAKLEVGAITTFSYASKVNSLLIGLFGTAFGVAIYPYLSDLAAQRNTRALTHLAWRIAAFIVPVTLVASLLVFMFSQQLVELLFARGSFTQNDTVLVAGIQRIFAFQLVFYVAGLVAIRVLHAVRASQFVMWIACFGVALNALFDWLFYEWLGAGGIALASVLTSAASLAFSMLFIAAALKRVRD